MSHGIMTLVDSKTAGCDCRSHKTVTITNRAYDKPLIISTPDFVHTVLQHMVVI